MRASSEEYMPQKDVTRVVESYDGYKTYLLITDAKTRYTWVYLSKTKEPPVDFLRAFLDQYGLDSGYRAVRLDQGGELWRSSDMCTLLQTAKYVMEPTGAGCPHMNGKVERLNGAFGVMVRSLLFRLAYPRPIGVLLLFMLFT